MSKLENLLFRMYQSDAEIHGNKIILVEGARLTNKAIHTLIDEYWLDTKEIYIENGRIVIEVNI